MASIKQSTWVDPRKLARMKPAAPEMPKPVEFFIPLNDRALVEAPIETVKTRLSNLYEYEYNFKTNVQIAKKLAHIMGQSEYKIMVRAGNTLDKIHLEEVRMVEAINKRGPVK
jgi:hypothetical protein